MMLGARTAAWAKSGYTAKDYVQDGLIAMWDGIENAGFGVHDSAATEWKDLTGNGYNLMSVADGSTDKWIDGCLNLSSNKYSSLGFSIDDENIGAIEVCGRHSNESGSCLLIHFNGYKMFGILPTQNRGFQFLSGGASMFKPFDVDWSVSCNYHENDFTTFYNGIEAEHIAGTSSWIAKNVWRNNGSYPYRGRVYCMRLYSRNLTQSEIGRNCAIDKARFNLPDAA